MSKRIIEFTSLKKQKSYIKTDHLTGQNICQCINLYKAILFVKQSIHSGIFGPQLKLVNPTQYRFEHLATQLKWRLQEGRGEAVYQIGVEDNGLLVGLTEADMKASLKTLKRMAERWVLLGGGPR